VTSRDYDVIVIGGGMVGAAIGYGLAGGNRRVLILDGADTDYRASKANFGLVWAHGKGMGQTDYQRLSIDAARAWPGFAETLEAESGMRIVYENKGGLHFCLGEKEFSERTSRMRAWAAQAPEVGATTQMLDREDLIRRFPAVQFGPDVSGASFGELDGHVNPLQLLAALHTAYARRGGQLLTHHAVNSIKARPGGGFDVTSGQYRAGAARVMIASGLGSSLLGEMVGLNVPLRPQRGQILVTERLGPLLPVPASGLRQTGEGTVMVGATQEEVGYDLATTSDGALRLVRRALRILPQLAGARLVRQWAALRVMTPDGMPVYAHSVSHPGAALVTCHSGVTLASLHAGPYAESLVRDEVSTRFTNFHHDRFNVQEAA
jgi:glycine/D-amino acid oxidase-like deaminating enzyme